MKSIKYDKLVRDRIPEIIQKSGKVCTTEILSDDEYVKKLNEKLIEECKEYQDSKEIEELADMLEVMYAIVKTRGCSADVLENIRKEKAEKRGAFDEKILLKEVFEQ